jgi:hypothetical protein
MPKAGAGSGSRASLRSGRAGVGFPGRRGVDRSRQAGCGPARPGERTAGPEADRVRPGTGPPGGSAGPYSIHQERAGAPAPRGSGPRGAAAGP